MEFVKCKLCDVDISGEKCIFATIKKTIDGKELYFCSERHAEEYNKKLDEHFKK